MMTEDAILGLDIGGTKTAAVLGTPRGTFLARRQIPTAAHRGFELVYRDIVELGRSVLHDTRCDVKAVSVSIGGPLDILKGIIYSPPNLPGWDEIPLKDHLFKDFNLPVYVEHDGNAGAYAEYAFGAGRGCRNIAFLTMGTGFGAGLILDGRVYRGTSDTAGEIGHIRIAEDGPDCYGKRGSLEGFASGTGIAKLAQMMHPDRWPEGVTMPDLYADYQQGAHEAREVFARAALYLGRGFALLVDLLNPERIILGGIGMRLHDALVVPAIRVYQQEALPRARDACQIVPAQLGETIGDYAALTAAFDQGSLLEH
jgi:glucokinase